MLKKDILGVALDLDILTLTFKSTLGR